MPPPKLVEVPRPSDSAPDDHECMRRFRAGDASAFEALYGRHKRGVYNFCRRMLGPTGDAGSAMQEVFLRVINAAGRWRAEAKFTTWLYTIARNHCHDVLRQKRPADTSTHRATVDGLAAEPPSRTDPPLRDILARAIGCLPDPQREVFLMRAYLDMSFPEIAEVVGAPTNTMKSRMRLAVGQLRDQLRTDGILPGDD